MTLVPSVTTQSQFGPLGAGALLATVLVLCLATGALIGWAAGSTGYGIVGGALSGVPLAIFVVYRRYRGYLGG
jgi:hypothetical protein